jgi:hypothetical protein
MSALGQKRTYALQQAMSALPPIATAKADIGQRPLGQSWHRKLHLWMLRITPNQQ